MPRPFPSRPPGDTTAHAVWRWLIGTVTGRVLLFGAVVKIAAALLRAATTAETAEPLDTLADIALVAGALMLAYRLFVGDASGGLLWRVRSKLTVSYIFIGFIPVFLIIVLFLTSGALLFLTVSQYMTRSGVGALVDQAAFLAESAAVGLQDISASELRERLERRQAGAEKAFPFVSYAVVPGGDCGTGTEERGDPPEVVTAGAWRHVDAPTGIPAWMACGSHASLIAYSEPDEVVRASDAASPAHFAARAVAWPDTPSPRFAVIVDVPFSAALRDRLQQDTGIDVGEVTTVTNDECPAHPLPGRAIEAPSAATPISASSGLFPNPLTEPLGWVSFLQYVDWETGRTCGALMAISMTIADLYNRIAAAPTAERGALDLAEGLLLLMAVVVVLFLVIQIAAFTMGLALARSITGAVHELFAGTERVRRGDFTHKIPIRSRDQLGELAESFNSMTSSIEDLLQQKAEKERMEQELRIARNIQMSLLPQGGFTIPGFLLSAHCEPAREVGGDYYDYLPIDEHRVGLLIADVAGKGTSAALYMAELKGLMLSLSQLHTSPRRLLIDANRIISRHLDSRSFITITYAVVDTQAGTLTYARAGHCPLIYVPGPQAPSRDVQILAPDGLVLGLQIDDGQRFNGLLEEATLSLGPGDLFLFYTDGLTEAMDVDGNCFGDERLGALVREHADMPFEELRERILREIAIFSGAADQQDDMTMLLLKVEGAADARDTTAGAVLHARV